MLEANPYAEYGTPVTNSQFIGRERELRQIHARAFGERGFGSLAVVGLPRMGKSSLVEEAIRREIPNFAKLRAAVVRAELGSLQSVRELFVVVVRGLRDELRFRGLSTSLIENRAEVVFREEGFTPVKDFFEALREHEVRPICVLEEFDAGRYLFTHTPQCFHWLRELAQAPRFKAVLVLLAKRQLGEIARIAGHESNYWSNVLHTITLKSFSGEERELYRRQLTENGILLSDGAWAEVTETCGGTPYLLGAFGFHAHTHREHGETFAFDAVREQMGDVLRSYFTQVRTILEDGPWLRAAIQVFIGPQHDVTSENVKSLIDYGLIERGKDGRLRAFTQSFEEYLHLIEATIDIWPLWRETERALRSALDSLFNRALGPDWIEVFRQRHPQMASVLAAAEAKMRHEERRFGRRASDNLLAYTYPAELFQLMTADWQQFGEPLLGGERGIWSKKFDVLAKIRTPLAHNREEAISRSESKVAEQICNDILDQITPADAFSGSEHE